MRKGGPIWGRTCMVSASTDRTAAGVSPERGACHWISTRTPPHGEGVHATVPPRAAMGSRIERAMPRRGRMSAATPSPSSSTTTRHTRPSRYAATRSRAPPAWRAALRTASAVAIPTASATSGGQPSRTLARSAISTLQWAGSACTSVRTSAHGSAWRSPEALTSAFRERAASPHRRRVTVESARPPLLIAARVLSTWSWIRRS